ncbi:hypothetical protein QFW77_16945 [Luteimonas sp. RD2P54]|uniref:Nuclear transport factor 2 family protein n=1 Tax=Luteimonas endophytica TaxID=3042023 RepID=A0ABT6JDK9_9GAMM|nr:hypothetical protein [Luteimonas endophytica]MDH5824660.1 hypothetical protein [Luteimonas endophytica]
MLKKLLAILALAVVALVAHDQGRRISEADVRAHYREQMDALQTFDSEAICAAMAADFRLEDVQHAAGEVHPSTLDRAAACRQMEDAIALLRTLSEQTGGLLVIEFGYQITGIEISPDGRRALVDATSTAKVGGRLLSRSRSKDSLSRSLWRVRSHGGQAQTWNYGG